MSHTPAPSLGRRLLEAVRRRLPLGRPDRSLRTDGGQDRTEDDDTDDHLRDVPDGAGCTEIWEHLSERDAPEARADD